MLTAAKKPVYVRAMGERVLILSASVGAGHVRAAQAVDAAVRELDPAAEVETVDVLGRTNAAFRRVYGSAYLDLVNKAPHVLGYMYDLLDRPVTGKARGDRLRLLVERMNLRKFHDLLDEKPWDVVVNTHFLPAEIIANLRRQGRSALRQMTVTTDFDTHRLWVNEPTDLYTTATADGAAYLAHWGVPAANVAVTGIPIDPKFTRPVDRAATLAGLGFDGTRPVVLQLAGGFGVGPIAELYKQVLSVDRPVDVVVVAGKNEAVKAELDALPLPARHRAKVLGFTDRMHEWMAVADVVISKPGGLTTSEVLASGAAMLIVNPIPGQESRNSDYLLEQGAAAKVNAVPLLGMKLAAMLGDPGRLASLKANATRIATPRAAYAVAERALAMAGG